MSARAGLQGHFEGLEKQTHAARLGMWIFLATELLLFSGLFVSYAAYRYLFPTAFAATSRHLALGLGTANTLILLTSSLTVALAYHHTRHGRARAGALLLAVSFLLGLAFLGVKAVEYRADFREGLLPGPFLRAPELAGVTGAAMFMSLYFLMTGLHAIHVTAGLAVLGALTVLTWRGAYTPAYHTPVELGAMYWHLVDVVWIFLWPLLYLL